VKVQEVNFTIFCVNRNESYKRSTGFFVRDVRASLVQKAELHDEEDIICNIEGPRCNIIALTEQDDEEDRLHQQMGQVVVKTAKHHLNITLGGFSSEHREYIVKTTIVNKGAYETNNDEHLTVARPKIVPIYEKDNEVGCNNYTGITVLLTT
jgi:hypothetical protein